MKTLTKIAAAALVIALPLAPASAQDSAGAAAEEAKPKVSLKSDVMAVETVIDENGDKTIKLVAPTTFTPGTVLSFGMNYANSGTAPATNVTGTNPLHEAVRLSPDADPALIVSVDGGKTYGTLGDLSVSTESEGSRPASHADVTHVRWTIASIAPGESGRIAFPVIIR
ncbi:MAG: hypothetical protein SXU28_14145 [Pseudomonadota bacterium]|nr:hypothetical protein [Pseudomonadota bacterium]